MVEFNLIIKYIIGKINFGTFTIDRIDSETSILDIKNIIKIYKDIPINQQFLYLDTILLQDTKLIKDYSILSSSTLILKHPS